MSPNEAQLRAALHDGEGDSPDANALISHALDVRRDRRKRINAIAGGVAAVAVVGVGTTVLVALARTGNESAAGGGGKAAGGRAATHNGSLASGVPTHAGQLPVSRGSSTVDGVQSQAKDAATGFANALRCPAAPERLLLPGGGGSGQFGSTDPLFNGDVAAMRVCGYPVRAGASTRSAVVSDPEASGLAKALDAEPATRSGDTCPPNTDFVGGTIEILGVNARGTALKPVVITLECVTSTATNGTAVRYLINVPDRLVRLVAVSPTKSTSNGTPGQVQGSPAR